MPLLDTQGNDSADAYGGGGVASVINYIENVFSTYLFNTSTSNQNIVNGIDLATYGGLTWIKSRSNVFDHVLQASANSGASPNALGSNSTTAAFSGAYRIANLSNGFTFGTDYYTGTVQTAVSWTFRKQPKFFDVVTYTGTGSNTTIAHNLGSVPGCIIVKRTDTTGDWQVYHNGLTSAAYSIQLDLTNAQASTPTVWNSTAPTSTVFSVGTNADVNASGGTYVAYIYAHNAGGFGLTGTDNVISCGSFTTDGSGNATVNLGYEPQWVMLKTSSTSQNWFVLDTMRGWSLGPNEVCLSPNLSSAESVFNSSSNSFFPTATGFQSNSGLSSSTTFIYIAIRRGPMKVPTDATKVFAPLARNTNGTNTTITTTLTNVDMLMVGDRNGIFGLNSNVYDRLRGAGAYLATSKTQAENTIADTLTSFAIQTGYSIGTDTNGVGINYNVGSPFPLVNWQFTRAPSVFDVVCYTGTGSAQALTHNLGAVPEMMIVKARGPSGTSTQWRVYSSATGATQSARLNQTDAFGTNTAAWNSTAPTSSVFTVGTDTSTNEPAFTFVAYLFATCAGVSKVGSYTGTGATQTISCGFTGGARFVLVKRTDTTGDWYVWDTARGMVSGTDPSLLLNSTAAEVNANSIYTATGGFQIVSTAAGINASGGTYIFLAIA